MRIAIIGTPRSGNTAMRSVLAAAYELTEMASHDASFLRSDLPDNTIAQVHCAYDQGLRDHLRSQDIDIVTPRRHPLDTLLSMLHFAQFEPQVANWLGGNWLHDLEGCDPTSREFREFALGAGAQRLLSVSVDWAPHARVDMRYRAFAQDPLHLVRTFNGGELSQRAYHGVQAAGQFARLASTPNMHGWLGTPGYWTSFISAPFARELYQAHERAFVEGGFSIRRAQEISPVAIRKTWAAAYFGDTSALTTDWSTFQRKIPA